MNRNLLLLCYFVSIVAAQEATKKRVQFQRAENDFNFGDPIKPKAKDFGVTPLSTQQRVQPGQVIFQKSALRQPQQQQQLLQQKQHQKIGTINEGGPFIAETRPTFADQSAFLPQAQNLDAQLQQTGNERQIGPTRQSLAYTSPQRFYLPQNAPITSRFEGPNLPVYYGVPGGVIPRIPNVDSYSPFVENYVGQRDDLTQIIVDPTDPDELDIIDTTPLEAPYIGPDVFTQLRQVTPLQPAVTDPLAPEVTNNRGVFFPNQPGTSGAYIQTGPEPQLIAQPIDDGAYFVEPVRDPIVFFDPNSNQTLVYDPLRDYTRLYNPETDPELQDDAEFGGDEEQPMLMTTNPNNPNGGFNSAPQSALLKSGGVKSTKFWIIRKHQPMQGYEKSAINGAASQPTNPLVKTMMKRNVNTGEWTESKVIYAGKPKQKGGPVGEQMLVQFNPNSFEKLIVQNDPSKEQIQTIHKTSTTNPQTAQPQPQPKKPASGYIKLVYSPIVDVPIGSRYPGFKAQNSSSAPIKSTSFVYSLFLTILIPVFSAIFF
jgi:hypothetical protein